MNYNHVRITQSIIYIIITTDNVNNENTEYDRSRF